MEQLLHSRSAIGKRQVIVGLLVKPFSASDYSTYHMGNIWWLQW